MLADCLGDEPSRISKGMVTKVSVISDEGVWSMVDEPVKDQTNPVVLYESHCPVVTDQLL